MLEWKGLKILHKLMLGHQRSEETLSRTFEKSFQVDILYCTVDDCICHQSYFGGYQMVTLEDDFFLHVESFSHSKMNRQ